LEKTNLAKGGKKKEPGVFYTKRDAIVDDEGKKKKANPSGFRGAVSFGLFLDGKRPVNAGGAFLVCYFRRRKKEKKRKKKEKRDLKAIEQSLRRLFH